MCMCISTHKCKHTHIIYKAEEWSNSGYFLPFHYIWSKIQIPKPHPFPCQLHLLLLPNTFRHPLIPQGCFSLNMTGPFSNHCGLPANILSPNWLTWASHLKQPPLLLQPFTCAIFSDTTWHGYTYFLCQKIMRIPLSICNGTTWPTLLLTIRMSCRKGLPGLSRWFISMRALESMDFCDWWIFRVTGECSCKVVADWWHLGAGFLSGCPSEVRGWHWLVLKPIFSKTSCCWPNEHILNGFWWLLITMATEQSGFSWVCGNFSFQCSLKVNSMGNQFVLFLTYH